jgi:REP element-mobilizing transposase RayT
MLAQSSSRRRVDREALLDRSRLADAEAIAHEREVDAGGRSAKHYVQAMVKRARGEQIAMFDTTGAVALPAKKERKRRRGVALGRKPRADRVGFVPHAKRGEHDSRHPVHVSMRRVRLAPSLRSERMFHAILVELARVKRLGVRVAHYSVQHDHLHLIVEGKDRRDLSNQMRKLFSRIALAVNAIAKRRGSLFRDRHHREELDGPTKMRNRSSTCSSMTASITPEVIARLRARYDDIEGLGSARTAPRTWLAQCGWRVRGRGGALRLHELPRFL